MKLLLILVAAVSVVVLFLDRRWVFNTLRLRSAPIVLLILGIVMGASWLLGVVITRVLNLPDHDIFNVLGVGFMATVISASVVVLVRVVLNMVRRQ